MTEPAREEGLVPHEGLKETFASGVHFKNKFEDAGASKMTKSTSSIKAPQVLTTGDGTGGSGGTRNFLSVGNTRQDKLERKVREEKLRGTAGSHGPDYVKALLNKYYKGGRGSTGLLGKT